MFNGLGKGAIALIVSGFVCKFFGALFRLPLTSILGIRGIGVFQMVMSLYSLALIFVTGGVTNSLAHLISSARARGEVNKIYSFATLSLTLAFCVALILGFGFFILAPNIAFVQGAGEGALAYRLFIVLIPVGALIGVLRGIIQGHENMVPTAVSQILEQVFKLTLGLLFAYIFGKRSVSSGVFGGFLGITLSEVIAFVYLGIFTLRHIKFSHMRAQGQFPLLISAVVPLTLSSAVIPFAHAFDSFVIVERLVKAGFSSERATSLFGLQTGVVGAILNIPLIISLSLAMALLPKISYLSSKNDEKSQQNVIKTAFVAMWAVVLPLTVGIMAICENLYLLLYPSTITPVLGAAKTLTYLGGEAIILTAIMQFLLSILQARGCFIYSFICTVAGAVAKMLIVFFLSSNPQVNIFAIPLSNIVLSAIVCVLLLIKVGELVKIPALSLVAPILASIVMFFFVRLVARANISNIWIVVISVFVGAVIYFICAFPVLKGLFFDFFGKNKGKDEDARV